MIEEHKRWMAASEVIPMFPSLVWKVVVRVGSGTLLIFPSWLEHSVDANPTEAERISVSFNTMLSSFAQQLSQPLWGGENAS